MRIVTRPDFDGIVCAVLLQEVEPVIGPVKWAEPGDMQKGLVSVSPDDIIANLPYHPNCAMWFDHHFSNQIKTPFKGAFKIAPSAAGVIHDYYRERFKHDFTELVAATDKIDAANLTLEEVEHPEKFDYIILSMTLGHSNDGEYYWNRMVDLLRTQEIKRVVTDPEVRMRIDQAIEANQSFRDYLLKYTRMQGEVAITDLRPVHPAPRGNRFLVYSLFPEAIVNVKIQYVDPEKTRVMVKLGHSIFKPGCRVNVGLLLSGYDGGGHFGAGSCRLPAGSADEHIEEIIRILMQNQPVDTPAANPVGN